MPEAGPAAARAWLSTVPLAHRGLWGVGVPENSLPAFAAARDAGVGVELDVRLAADGVPVVVHDRRLARLTGERGAVAARTSGELGAMRLGGTDAVVPTLAAALATAGEVPVMVEVKSERTGAGPLEPAVAAVLADHPGPTCVASFNVAVLRWFRRHRPEQARVLTAGPGRLGSGDGRMVTANLAPVRLVDPVAISYALDGLALPAVRRWRHRGMPVVTWTVRTVEDLAVARSAADNVVFEALRVEQVRA